MFSLQTGVPGCSSTRSARPALRTDVLTHIHTRARVHRMSGPTDLLTYYWEQGFQDALHWNVAPAAPDTIADPRLHLLPLTLALSKKINKISTQEGGVLCPSVPVLV